MLVEGSQLFSEHQVISAASTTSKVIDLGKNGDSYCPPWVSVNLTAPFTAGKIDSIKLQTSDTEAFSVVVDVQTITVPTTVVQSLPAVLLQLRLPQRMKRWARLVYTASGTPAGGKVFAAITGGVPLR